MKAQGVNGVPAGGSWHCEIKFDGYRAVAVLNRGQVALWSRNEKPLNYLEILPPLQRLKCRSAVVDGEIVALDSAGRSNFQGLQGRDLGERPPIVYFVFDLLQLNGESCLELPFEKRRELLTQLIAPPLRRCACLRSTTSIPQRCWPKPTKKAWKGSS